jgi:carbon monoxide dehydrogenase subunit G
MPGVESFDVQDERHWKANLLIPLGLGGLRMSINFEKTEERPIEYARLHAKGSGVGAILRMETGFHLSEGDGGTQMRWEADVHVAGPVGSMGQRVLQPIVRQQVQNVLTALDEQVREGAAGAEPSPEPAATGTSAAEEGLHPASPETYEPEAEGPTHSTGGSP